MMSFDCSSKLFAYASLLTPTTRSSNRNSFSLGTSTIEQFASEQSFISRAEFFTTAEIENRMETI